MRKLSHGMHSLQRVGKAALGALDFRLHCFRMRSLGALLSAAEQTSQIGVASIAISVFHGWHETAFDLAVNRRVSPDSYRDDARRNKLRSGGKGNQRTRGRSSASTRHRQREPLRFAIFHCSALAMTFAGADGDTRTEMARVLHFPSDASAVAASFASLQHSLEEMSVKTADLVKKSKEFGGPSEPITLSIANKLFAQKGYAFRPAFLSLVKQNFGAAFEPLDFVTNASTAIQHINKWVADQTHDRIRDLIPGGALDETTRLVLANAL